jgi:hypothetical protein
MQTLPKSIHQLNMQNLEQFKNENKIRKLSAEESFMLGQVMNSYSGII